MVEVNLTYDLVPGIDEEDYKVWVEKATHLALSSAGIREVVGYRSLTGSPEIRLVTVWNQLSNWSFFEESQEWQKLLKELRKRFATGLEFRTWGPSPLIPEKLTPSDTAEELMDDAVS